MSNDVTIMIIVAAASAALPMAGYTMIVWWLDRYDREPFWLVALMFGYGATLAPFLAYMIQGLVIPPMLHLIPASTLTIVGMVGVAPLAEELCKIIPFWFLFRHPQFDNSTDGIVYGSSIGFGFGMTENLCYFINTVNGGNTESFFWIIGYRTLFVACIHAFTTGLAGYAVGAVKVRRRAAREKIWSAVILAIFFHLFWNGLVVFSEINHRPQLIYFFLCCFPLIFLFLFLLMQRSLHEESLIIRHELSEEALLGYIPAEYVKILPFYHRRLAKGWFLERDRKWLVRQCTSLCLRKWRLRFAAGPEADRLRQEIAGLRESIALLLEQNALAAGKIDPSLMKMQRT